MTNVGTSDQATYDEVKTTTQSDPTAGISGLTKSGMSDAWIMKNIGMDAEELLRLKQLSGLQELFKDNDFGRAWV